MTNKSSNLMEKNNFVPGAFGVSLPLSSFAHQNDCNVLTKQVVFSLSSRETESGRICKKIILFKMQHNCGLDSDGSAENKLNSPVDKIVAGGVLGNTFYKNHYKAAVEQLAALNLSKKTRAAQLNSNSNKLRAFHSWSYMYHQGINAVNRGFSKTFAEMSSSSSDTPVSLINTSPMLVGAHSVNKYQSISYPGAQQTSLENCSRNGDGDFSKTAHEALASDSYPTTDSSSDDIVSVRKLDWKAGNSHSEDSLLAEKKNAFEGSKNRTVLLKYFKNANLNLRPESIKDIETSPSAECSTFPYPDFLPPPFNKLDLKKLSKWDDWKLSFQPPLEESLDKLISRLVEMERLQHLTILKEKTKEQSASPTMALNNRPSSTKDTYQLKHLKTIDLLCPQAAFDGEFHSFGSCVQEPDLPKCACHHCHHKWNSGSVSSLRSKPLRSSCNKCTKMPVTLDSSNIVSRRSLSCTSSAKIRSAVKMLSPSTPVAFFLPDCENSKCKQPRSRRKSWRKNVALMGKPFTSQKLKSLSVLATPKYTPVDHQ